MTGPIGHFEPVVGQLGVDTTVAIAIVVADVLIATTVFFLYLAFAIPTPAVRKSDGGEAESADAGLDAPDDSEANGTDDSVSSATTDSGTRASNGPPTHGKTSDEAFSGTAAVFEEGNARDGRSRSYFWSPGAPGAFCCSTSAAQWCIDSS